MCVSYMDERYIFQKIENQVYQSSLTTLGVYEKYDLIKYIFSELLSQILTFISNEFISNVGVQCMFLIYVFPDDP